MPRSILISVVLLLAANASSAQTSISLRGSATLPQDAQEVRLADIAELSGPDATTLGAVVVVAQPQPGRDRLLRVDISDVRAALAATHGVNAGKLTLRGAACTVQMGDPPAAAPAAAASCTSDANKPAPIDMTGPETIRTVIAARVAVAYGVSVDRLRLGFDPAEQSVLSTPIGDRMVDIDLGASPGSARMPVTVTLYRGDRIDLSRTVQTDVSVRRTVATAATALERGKTIGADDLLVDDRWGPPTLTAPPAADDLIGQVTAKRIAAGETLDRDDFAAPVACKRGDTVYVHCISGSVVVKVKARALGTARDGELVQLKVDGPGAGIGGGRDATPFTARMSGKGRAVMNLQGSTSEQER